MTNYEQALKLFREIGDKLGEANTLQSMGKMNIISATDQSSFEEGMQILQSALSLYEEIHEQVGQVNILMFISRVMANMNQIEKALEIANRALPMLIGVAGENHPVTTSFQEFFGLQNKADEEKSKTKA